MKPAHEPVVFARKPLGEATIVANVLKWGTGAINIDAARVGYKDGMDLENAAAAAARVLRDTPGRERWSGHGGGSFNDPSGSLDGWRDKAEQGRWPANVITDSSLEVLEAFPPSARDAIRFFYAAKADKADREFGLDGAQTTTRAAPSGDGIGNVPKVNGERPNARANVHPTVKPVDLMRWLCRLITPPGGVVLDPFMGSGSTGIAAVREGFRFVGVEQSPEYFEIACARIAAAVDEATKQPNLVNEITKVTRRLKDKKSDQGELL